MGSVALPDPSPGDLTGFSRILGRMASRNSVIAPQKIVFPWFVPNDK
ncbi:hypothetical protein MCEMSEM23_01474 [Rhabdaerophilaceae bacterium]